MSDLPLDVDQLQQDLADSAARADIETLCRWAYPDGAYGHRFYDTGAPLKRVGCTPREGASLVERAELYLTHRGILRRHAVHPELVRFADVPTAAETLGLVAGGEA